MRPEPTPTVAAWIADCNAVELYLTAVGESEPLYDVAIMPTSRRRNAVETAMNRWGLGEYRLFRTRNNLTLLAQDLVDHGHGNIGQGALTATEPPQ